MIIIVSSASSLLRRYLPVKIDLKDNNEDLLTSKLACLWHLLGGMTDTQSAPAQKSHQLRTYTITAILIFVTITEIEGAGTVTHKLIRE